MDGTLPDAQARSTISAQRPQFCHEPTRAIVTVTAALEGAQAATDFGAYATERNKRGYTSFFLQVEMATTYLRLQRNARHLVGNREDAEDVVQDAMERAWRFRDRFRAGADAGRWLRALVRRAAVDVLRKRRTNLPMDDTQAAAEFTEEAVLLREAAALLAGAIMTLPAAQREALVQHDFLGYSSREIALRESVPYQTVRTRLFRARRALRNVYRLKGAA